MVLHSMNDTPEAGQGSVTAVTIYGSGLIEYHLPAAAASDEPVPYRLADQSQSGNAAGVEELRARLAAVEDLIRRAECAGVTTIDRVLVARAAQGGER